MSDVKLYWAQQEHFSRLRMMGAVLFQALTAVYPERKVLVRVTRTCVQVWVSANWLEALWLKGKIRKIVQGVQAMWGFRLPLILKVRKKK